MATDRENFETWIKEHGGDLSTFGSGQNTHYRNSAVNNAWTGLQARAAPASAPAAAIDPDNCAQEVYEHGASVGRFDIPKETANAICAGISAATGARVDWHYIGGRVHIKALPATAQPAPQAGAADPKRQYFYKNNKCESYNSSKSSCTCWHDEGTGPFAEGRSGLTWREKPTEQPSQIIPQGLTPEEIRQYIIQSTAQPSQDAERLDWIIRQGDEFRCFVITDAPSDGEYAAWGDGMDAHGKGKTAREAIDAARAAQAQGGAA